MGHAIQERRRPTRQVGSAYQLMLVRLSFSSSVLYRQDAIRGAFWTTDEVAHRHCPALTQNPNQSQKVLDRYRILQEDLGVGQESLEFEALNQARENTRRFIQEQAMRSLTLKQQAQAERWNKKARELKVQPGAQVHIRTIRGQGKVLAKKAKLEWEGPYTVLELRPRGNLLVQKNHTPGAKPEVWHIQNVKPAWERPQRRKALKVNHLALKSMASEPYPGADIVELPLLCYRYGPAKDAVVPME